MTLQEAIAQKRSAQAERLIEEECLAAAVIELLVAKQAVHDARERLEAAGSCRWMRATFAAELEEAEERLLDRVAIAEEWGVL